MLRSLLFTSFLGLFTALNQGCSTPSKEAEPTMDAGMEAKKDATEAAATESSAPAEEVKAKDAEGKHAGHHKKDHKKKCDCHAEGKEGVKACMHDEKGEHGNCKDCKCDKHKEHKK